MLLVSAHRGVVYEHRESREPRGSLSLSDLKVAVPQAG